MSQPCTDGMWSKDLLVTVATDTGVISLWDGRSLQPLAQAYSTFNVRAGRGGAGGETCRVTACGYTAGSYIP